MSRFSELQRRLAALAEIASDGAITQRSLASKLEVSLGLANALLRGLESDGLIKSGASRAKASRRATRSRAPAAARCSGCRARSPPRPRRCCGSRWAPRRRPRGASRRAGGRRRSVAAECSRLGRDPDLQPRRAGAGGGGERARADLAERRGDRGGRRVHGRYAARLARFGSRITVIRQEHRGPAVARNAGIRASQGEWIGFLDSDDLWMPEKIARCVAALEGAPDAGVAYTAVRIHELDTGRKYPLPQYTMSGNLARDLFLECKGVNTSTLVVRRAALDKVGLFDEEFFRAQDWDLMVRLAEQLRLRARPGNPDRAPAARRKPLGHAPGLVREVQPARDPEGARAAAGPVFGPGGGFAEPGAFPVRDGALRGLQDGRRARGVPPLAALSLELEGVQLPAPLAPAESGRAEIAPAAAWPRANGSGHG